jgi:hypothetical protein
MFSGVLLRVLRRFSSHLSRFSHLFVHIINGTRLLVEVGICTYWKWNSSSYCLNCASVHKLIGIWKRFTPVPRHADNYFNLFTNDSDSQTVLLGIHLFILSRKVGPQRPTLHDSIWIAHVMVILITYGSRAAFESSHDSSGSPQSLFILIFIR